MSTTKIANEIQQIGMHCIYSKLLKNKA